MVVGSEGAVAATLVEEQLRRSDVPASGANGEQPSEGFGEEFQRAGRKCRGYSAPEQRSRLRLTVNDR